MKIAVLSCDKNEETFAPFHHCMEKYWPGHPEVIYHTNGIINPYYKTITVPEDLSHWTKGVREFLNQIDDEIILLMIDDIFIRRPVDVKRVKEAAVYLKNNVAMMNFEKSWDENDKSIGIKGWKKRKHGSSFEVSLMCGLWQKEKLLKVLERDCDPWTIELEQDGCGFDYYINSGDYIIDWGYKTFQPCGIVKGKWAREVVDFFKTEGLDVDYSIKGFYEES